MAIAAGRRSKQARLRAFHFRKVPHGRFPHMADRNIAEHLLEQVSQITSRGDAAKIRLVFVFRSVEIEIMEVAVAETIALGLPGL